MFFLSPINVKALKKIRALSPTRKIIPLHDALFINHWSPDRRLLLPLCLFSDACLGTTTAILRPFVPDYPSEPGPEVTFSHSHLSWSTIILYLLPPSTISLFKLCAWQSFCITSVQVFFGLSLAPSTSYSIYFLTQSLSSFRNTCPYQCNLFCCSTNIMSYNPSLSFSQLFT